MLKKTALQSRVNHPRRKRMRTSVSGRADRNGRWVCFTRRRPALPTLFQRVECRQDVVSVAARKPTVGIKMRSVRLACEPCEPCAHHHRFRSFNVVFHEDSNVAGHPTYQLDQMDGNLKPSSI